MNYFKLWFDVPVEFEGHCYIEIDKAEYWLTKGRTFHREGGPAITTYDGREWWCTNGVYHRIDGPTTITLDGKQVFYINGKRFTPEDYFTHPLVLKHKLESILKQEKIT